MERGLEYQNQNSPEAEDLPEVEKVETPREIIHYEINEMLRNVRKQNEGAAGIIMKLDLGSFSPRLIDALQQTGISVTTDTAAKLLKVYSPGAVKHEFLMQQRAFESVEDSENQNLAKIPEPLFYSDVAVDSDVADNLRSQDIDLHDSNRVEILLMDWIPGQDLMTQMYKKVLDYFPEHPALPDNPDDFQQLRYSASILLGLEAPNLSVANAAQRETNEAVTYRRNIEKLLRFLDKKGLEINPKIAEQLENCVDVLHRNGIWHNDIHERNIVITGDIFEKGADAEIMTYLIDFGTASPSAEQRVLNDKDLVQTLRKASDLNDAFESRLNEVKKEIVNNPKYAETYEMIKSASKHLPMNGIEASYALFPDDDGYKTITALDQLLHEDLITTIQVKEKLNEILARKSDKRFQKRKNLKDYIESLH
jgi:tRNA A-37 threonylcarbamoyl transferase component Bud32